VSLLSTKTCESGVKCVDIAKVHARGLVPRNFRKFRKFNQHCGSAGRHERHRTGLTRPAA
jgi:hypothetical protein